ncbi:hypothetical protein [Janthinobacterium sp. GW458P]|uniref:hypothetical protein n=1 Tax=Janthinobacterium sp. GW458P TaxID=1981504 RepID=UPI00111DDE30|nr:hypothetical protein [Janthinobacterium sp. GW458P]MBE3026013.1 hypothetical protein [Janthinobacterium sp. GW458P]
MFLEKPYCSDKLSPAQNIVNVIFFHRCRHLNSPSLLHGQEFQENEKYKIGTINISQEMNGVNCVKNTVV